MVEDIKKHIKQWSWNKKPHKYQVGPMLFSREIQLDNYFIMKLFRKYITKEEFPAFYTYHLNHYFTSSKEPTEEKQFRVIWEIVEDGLRIQDRHPHSELAKKRKKKLLLFQEYLKSIDQWDYGQSLAELVELKNTAIKNLRDKLDSTKKELSRLKVDYKIRIRHVDRTSIFDLFLQLRELTSPEDGGRIFDDPAQSTWAKMLSNHFETEDPIPFDTALNYVRGKTKIQETHKIFEVKLKGK